MLTVQEINLSFGDKKLFDSVCLQFTPGNCYGIIGANGAGKSTFLKILSGEQSQDRGEVQMNASMRMSVLKQDQHLYDEHTVLNTILMGHEKLYSIMKEKDKIYEKEDFSDEDGMRVATLEEEFSSIGGWEAESEAGVLLDGLGLSSDILTKKMDSIEPLDKTRVLLAQALFGIPDILIMDEPTNGLDLESIQWLEDFLLKFENIAIIVSHNRHFLNAVCTHTLDIDYGKINMYVGNYDFWYESSQLMQRQRKADEKKKEKMQEDLKEFIRRFSSHKARAKQATSRKKLLEKIEIDQLPKSSRKFPYVHFSPERECGKSVLEIKNLTIEKNGETLIKDLSLQIQKDQKIAFVGPYNNAKTALFEALKGNKEYITNGEIEWGITILSEYYLKDNRQFFEEDISVLDWLSTYTNSTDERFIRGFLGRMLFSGDEPYKSVKVLSGGEKARCMLSKIMLTSPNVIIFDEPTNHLDLEAITSLNNALIDFKGVLLFNSHDQQFVDTVANRIIEITPNGIVDCLMSLSDYMQNQKMQEMRNELYASHNRIQI